MSQGPPKDQIITLVSNACTDIYPTNKHNSFRNQLKEAINDDSSHWEVAPISITYPHSFNNWMHNIGVGIIVRIPDWVAISRLEGQNGQEVIEMAGSMRAAMAAAKGCWPGDDYDFMIGVYKEFLVANNKTEDDMKKEPVFYDYFYLKPGYYASVQDVLNQICAGFERKIGNALRELFPGQAPRALPSLELKYTPTTRRLTMQSSHMKVTIFTKDEELWTLILGIPGPACLKTPAKEKKIPPYFQLDLPLYDSNTCSLVPIHSIFVSSDLIKYQLVGNTETPLLGVVPLGGVQEEIVTWVFNPTYYLPLARNDIREIEVQLNTENGDPFPFTSTSKVMLRLHVRKKY